MIYDKRGIISFLFLAILILVAIVAVFTVFFAVLWIGLIFASVVGLVYGISILNSSEEGSKDRKKAISIVVVSSIFLIISFSSVFSSEDHESPESSEENYSSLDENCASILNERKRNLCYKKIAEESGVVDFCKKMRYKETEDYGDNRNYCFKDVAIKTSNSSVCEFIIPDEDRIYSESMENDCYGEIAQKKDNPEICLKISTDHREFEMKECIEEIALSLDDPSVCSMAKTNDSSWIQDCKDEVYGEKI